MPASSLLNQFLQWEKEIPSDIFLRQPFNGQWKTFSTTEQRFFIKQNSPPCKGLFFCNHRSLSIVAK